MRRGSSFSDNPLLRVSRPVSACSRCRAAKVKCDGKLPACTACEKAGRETECSAANDQFARGKERSYVAALELRIEKLDRRLAYAKSRKASLSLHEADTGPPPEPNVRKDSLAAIREAMHRQEARKRENSDVNHLVSDFGYMSVNATTRDFDVSNMTFARLVLAASVNVALPDPTTAKLPPKDTALSIVQFYMDNIYPLYPAFRRNHITSLLDELYKDPPQHLRSSESWAFWLVLAIGSAAQSRSTDDQHYRNGVEFIARALPHADRALMPGYVSQLQALLLLTQYSMLDPAHFDSWHLIGFTCRAVIDLGFHQDPPQGQPPDDLEMRRRTFYCIYALDRAISMVHARAFSFIDDAISVALPAPLRAPPSPGGRAQAPDASVHLFKLRRLQSVWYQTLFQCDSSDQLPDATSFTWKMCHDMRQWSEALPNGLAVDLREMLDLELRYSYVYCIAPSSRAPHMTAYGRKLIFEHAIAYMDRIHAISSSDTSKTFYTYHDALRVYFMGSQFVAVLRDAADVLISGSSVPVPLSLPGQVPAPPLPERFDRSSNGDDLDRSLETLEKVSLTLQKYGQRWEYALQLKGSFEIMSAEVLDGLKARRESRESVPSQAEQSQTQHQLPSSQGIPSFTQHAPLPQNLSQQPLQDMRWAESYNGGLPDLR
ncbi:fungal-specific transcription factor domain-containing protein [Cercophora newfieldiana]|uniref:Fungal-specific transcription factor domain-containing protein n=1 Tax=Cercophora newfieldiana TaxID=92897 RepID=A0AA39XWQ8_9PEZI|nr:fungal-specific transcription factor domain-containing protein [Cercophora newfieldiana]